MRCVAVMGPLIAACAALCNGCATPRTVIEIPPCADRVEVTGQAHRLGQRTFELDHTFDLALTRTQVSFQANGDVKTVVVEANQPDPLRLFFGIGAVVGGALLMGSAAVGLAEGAEPLDAQPLALGVGGAALVGLGAGAALTGWHPAESVVAFPDACPAAAGRVTYER